MLFMNKYLENIINGIEVIVGTLLLAISINIFFVPNNIINGGASGLGIILNYLFNIDVSLIIVLLNLPLFIIAIKKIGFKFSIKAIIGTLLLALFIQITKNIKLDITKDLFLASIYGGIFNGIGMALVFKGGASTGGSELLAQIMYKYVPHLSMSGILLIIDSLIIMFSIFAYESINSGLYSLIAIYISKKTIDLFFEGNSYTKVINIITSKEIKIVPRILKEVGRGTTSYDCRGEYTQNRLKKLECIVTISQIKKVKRIASEEDIEAFVYITDVGEVLGNGFDNNKI